MDPGRRTKELTEENRRLAGELAEAREVLRAVRSGEVDAVVSMEADSVYALQVAALAVDKAETYEESLQLLLKQLCLTGGWLYGEAWAASSDRRSLHRTRAWYGGSSDAVRLHERIVRLLFDDPVESSLIKALDTGSPQWVYVEDLPPGGRAVAVAQCGLQTGIAFPVVVGGQVTAVLSLWKRGRQDRNDSILKQIEHILTECGPLVQRKREDEILRTTLSELEIAVRERSVEIADLSSRLQNGKKHPPLADSHASQPPHDIPSLYLQSVLASVSNGVVLADASGRVVHFSAAARKLLGDLACDAPLVLWPDIYGLHCADRVTRLDHRDLPLAGALRGETIERAEIFVRNSGQPEGAVLLVSARPLAGEGRAPPGAIMIFEDVTEGRLREEGRVAQLEVGRDTLLREVHHRIRNNLAAVAGLLQQQVAHHPEFRQIVDQLEPQLRAIAAVHGIKAGASTVVHLGPLIQSVAESAKQLYGASIEMAAPGPLRLLELQEEESVPLALVLNELLCNACKHGAGEALKIHVGRDGREVVITVVNNVTRGVPVPDMNGMAPGSGIARARALLPHGKASLRYERDGDRVAAVIRLDEGIFGAPAGA